MTKKRERFRPVKDFKDVPTFASEAEEAAYWAAHELGDEILERMQAPADDLLPPAREPAKPISIRMNAELLRRLKTLAQSRGVPYQTLIKQFVIERLYVEEHRDSKSPFQPVSAGTHEPDHSGASPSGSRRPRHGGPPRVRDSAKAGREASSPGHVPRRGRTHRSPASASGASRTGDATCRRAEAIRQRRGVFSYAP
jgi:predicted DNA binding CopG/RHH family protein